MRWALIAAVDIPRWHWTVFGVTKPWLIVLGAGRVPAELSGELGSVPSGQPPVGGVPAIVTLLRSAPIARIFVVLDPADINLGRLVTVVRPDATIIPQAPQGSVGAAFLAAYDTIAADYEPGSGYVTYADTITNFPDATDVITVHPSAERRWTTVERAANGLRIVEKNTTHPAAEAIVGMFHFSDLAAFAERVRRASRGGDVDVFHQGLVAYDMEVRTLALETAQRWLDVGHLDTYHDARRRALVARFFNHVRVHEHSPEILVKTGTNTVKIRQESNWYQTLPVGSTWLAPRLLGVLENGYELEYVPGLLVAESYLYGEHDDAYWSRLLNTVDRALRTLHDDTTIWESEIANAARRSVWITKTRERLSAVKVDQPHLSGDVVVNGELTPGIDAVLDELSTVVEASRLLAPRPVTRIHGDLHPGNMLYDHRTGVLKLVDPRGSFSVPGPYGDPLYDLAKLAHGFLGNYDALLFGCYELNRVEGNTLEIITPGSGPVMFREAFRGWLSAIVRTAPYNAEIEDIDLAVAVLFLSLAALHRELPERQEVFLLHGLSLWRDARKSFSSTP